MQARTDNGGSSGRAGLMVVIAVACAMLPSAPARAQGPPNRGSVVETAPIYLLPDRAHQPLRTAAEGTVLDVLTREGDWIQVRFRDPEFGPRVGFIESRFLSLGTTSDAGPLDVSVAGDGRADGRVAPTAIANLETTPVGREGFWFYGGLGYGLVGCDSCLGARDGGLSGGLTFGGTISPRVLLGVGTSGFTRTYGFGDRLMVGTVDARLRFYPSTRSGVFLTGGVGLGHLSFNDETEFGAGAMLGAGWDIRVGRNISLTPFYNGFAMRSSLLDANVGQFGLGLTIH